MLVFSFINTKELILINSGLSIEMKIRALSSKRLERALKDKNQKRMIWGSGPICVGARRVKEDAAVIYNHSS